MASKPSQVATWATDAVFSSGPESGTPTKVEPSSGYKAQGFVPGLNFVGPYVNWLLNLIYTWCVYLDDLHNSASFLGASYTWTGTQALGGSVETTYSAARSRTVALELTDGSAMVENGSGGFACPVGASSGIVINNGTAVTHASAWFRPLRLPLGAIITGWSAIVDPDDGGVATMTATLAKRSLDFTGATLPTASTISSQVNTGTARQSVGATGLSETVVADTEYYFAFSQDLITGAEAKIHGLTITFSETRATGHF